MADDGLTPCPICQEDLLPTRTDYYTWLCGHQVHLNCFCRIYIIHTDDVVSKRRDKKITEEDTMLSCPQCREPFDIHNGVSELKVLMKEFGFTKQSIRAWIRNDRVMQESIRAQAISVPPKPPLLPPQFMLVLCCPTLAWVEHSYPPRYERDENQRTCEFAPIGDLLHYLCNGCSRSVTQGNPLLQWPDPVGRNANGARFDRCALGCTRDKSLVVDLQTNSRYWACTAAMHARVQPSMLWTCPRYFIDTIDVGDDSYVTSASASASSSAPSSSGLQSSASSSGLQNSLIVGAMDRSRRRPLPRPRAESANVRSSVQRRRASPPDVHFTDLDFIANEGAAVMVEDSPPNGEQPMVEDVAGDTPSPPGEQLAPVVSAGAATTTTSEAEAEAEADDDMSLAQYYLASLRPLGTLVGIAEEVDAQPLSSLRQGAAETSHINHDVEIAPEVDEEGVAEPPHLLTDEVTPEIYDILQVIREISSGVYHEMCTLRAIAES